MVEAAAYVRHDAERAVVGTAALHRNEGTQVRKRVGYRIAGAPQRRKEGAIVAEINVVEVGLPHGELVTKLRQLSRAEDCINVRRELLHAIAILFGQASRDDQTQSGVDAFERVEMVHAAVCTALRVIANGAGVEHDHVRFLGGRRDAIPRRRRAFGDIPGVGFIHLTAESLDVNTGHSSFRTSRGGWAIPAPVGVARSH